MSPNKTVQYILKHHYQSYAKRHKQPLRVVKAIEPQIRCRTKAEGTSHYICAKDGEHKELHHSCRNKGCTVCGEKRKQQWLASQKARLLNCEHYHVVTTLPHEYLQLWLYNRKWFVQAQFESTRETLSDLLQGNRYKGAFYPGRLQAEPGFISTLHTWGRNLNLHPHIHTLITAGGLTAEGKWKKLDTDYLLPVKQVKVLYRGKFQSKIKALLKSEDVKIPAGESRESLLKLHGSLYGKEWSVRIQEKYGHGKGVLIYLSRYLGSSPVRPEQVTLVNHNKEVLFSYRSHRTKKREILRLSLDEFIKKYLIHQAQPKQHTIRYYGLYAGSSYKKRERSIAELGASPYQGSKLAEIILSSTHAVLCSCCGEEMKLAYVSFKSWRTKNPLYREGQLKGQEIGQVGTRMPAGWLEEERPLVIAPVCPSNKAFKRDKLLQRID